MNTQQARAVFTQAAASAAAKGDAEAVNRIELAREYFTNPDFRSAMERFVWSINSKVLK